jgi:endonuclease YncB( thermonuclease family)
MSLFAPFRAHTPPRHAVLLAVSAAFLLGLMLGGTIKVGTHSAAPVQRAFAVAPADKLAADEPPLAKRTDAASVYPAEVLRVIDGDTFAARVRVWPGLDVETKVRLRGIDAAELHARCAEEYSQAEAARAALQTILAEGGVTISRVGVDKYGGRVDALAATRATTDVSAAMLAGGWARPYQGGRRQSWCVTGVSNQ